MRQYLFLISIPAVFACTPAPQKDVLSPHYNIEEIQAQTQQNSTDLEKTQKTLEELNSNILSTRSNLQDLTVQTSMVSAARIEELETRLALLIEAYRDLYSDVASIRVLPQVKTAKTTAKKPEGFSSASVMTDIFGGSEYTIYSKGLQAYRNQFYEKARRIMGHLIETHPESDYIGAAHYWIGAAQMELKRFDKAVTSLERAEKAPGSDKKDHAALKRAQCYIALNDTSQARETLTYILERYPATIYRDIIEQTLADLSDND
ncbi:MAG: tetratricopeptide repeat protein [Fibrobacterota bacterium]